MVHIVQTSTRNSWFDRMGTLGRPSDRDLVAAYAGIAGACAQLNANGVADAGYALHRGDDNDSPEVSSHPFLEVLKRPNPHMGAKILFKTTQLYLEVTGKAYWRIIPGIISPVVEIYPLQPQLVTPVLAGSSQIVAWQYDKDALTLDEVVPFYVTDPANPYGGGRGPAELAWSEITLSGADLSTMYAMLINGASPATVMTPVNQDGAVPSTLLTRLQAAWGAFKGRKRGGMFIPPMQVDVKSLAQNSRDYQGSERLDQLKSTILAAFGVPAALFDSAGSRAELDSALVQWSRLAIDPRTTLLEDVVNRRIMPLFGDDVRFYFDDSLPEDAENAGGGLPGGPQPSAGTRMNPAPEQEKQDGR